MNLLKTLLIHQANTEDNNKNSPAQLIIQTFTSLPQYVTDYAWPQKYDREKESEGEKKGINGTEGGREAEGGREIEVEI